MNRYRIEREVVGGENIICAEKDFSCDAEAVNCAFILPFEVGLTQRVFRKIGEDEWLLIWRQETK